MRYLPPACKVKQNPRRKPVQHLQLRFSVVASPSRVCGDGISPPRRMPGSASGGAWMTRHSRLLFVLISFFLISCLSNAQILYQDQEVQVHDLPSLMARTHDPSDVLLTSLDTVFGDREMCCGRDSALEDAAQKPDPKSLPDIAAKLDGRHLLSDGRPIHIHTEYVAPDSVTAGAVVNQIVNQHAPLMMWNGHLYVVYGVVYIWSAADPTTGAPPVMYIHKFLLWDTRFSDSRRNVVFDRQTGDASKVQGLLFLLVDSKS